MAAQGTEWSWLEDGSVRTISPHISPYPHISPNLPISPHISQVRTVTKPLPALVMHQGKLTLTLTLTPNP